MSSLNQNGQSASVATATLANQHLLHTLETLIPKNLSNNKRAVIERLITLHQRNHSDR